MPLDQGFLDMLQGVVSLERKTGADQWGNDTYAAPTVERAYIDPSTVTFGGERSSDRQESTPTASTSLIMDGIGVEPGDKITFDSIPRWVEQVETTKDEFGVDLYQTITVTTTKRG